MTTRESKSDPEFRAAITMLLHGDFSALDPLFVGDPSRFVEWHRNGWFEGETEALAEAFTCACFNGLAEAAAYLVGQGVDPTAGNATGMDGFHWAVNRGQLEMVNMLIEGKVPLDTVSMYGTNLLGTARWSAEHEPRQDHSKIIEALILAGAEDS